MTQSRLSVRHGAGFDRRLTRARQAYGYDSGATLKMALHVSATDYGSTKYNDAFNRLNADRGFRIQRARGPSGAGQQAVGQITASVEPRRERRQRDHVGGNARAAGIVGSANAMANGITGAGNSLLQYQMFNKLFLQKATPGTSDFFP